MAQLIINIGNSPNDGTGDSAREGGAKINANFTELYDLIGNGSVTYDYNNLINTPNFGTAAFSNLGVQPYNVVQLDSTGKLPPLDGSQLVNLPYSGGGGGGGGGINISGVPTVGQITRWVNATTVEGVNTIPNSSVSGLGSAALLSVGTGANNVVQLDASARLPAVDGSLLTNLPANVLKTGTPEDDQFARWTNSNTLEGISLVSSHITDLDEAAGGNIVRQGLDAVITAGGANLTALEDTVLELISGVGDTLDIANLNDIWSGAAGILFLTPQSWSQAWAEQSITPVSDVITVNGSNGFNFTCTVSANTNFAAPINLIPGFSYRVTVKASGGNRVITATGMDITVNFGAGVTINSGKEADFIIVANADGDFKITRSGYSD